MSNSTSAKSIAQHVLDLTGEGLRTGDFESFAPCFLLPQTIETFDGKRYLASVEDVRAVFDAVRAHHVKMGITVMVRHVVSADYRDDTTISAIHQTRVVSGASLVQKPFNVFSILKLVDGKWRVAQSQYAVDDSPGLCQALVGRPPAMVT